VSVLDYKRLAFLLILSLGVLLVWVWTSNWECLIQRAEVKGTWDVIVEYDRTRHSLSEMNLDGDVAYLEIYAHTQPRIKDRYLSLIIKRERSRIFRDIIDDLRKKTREDLGDDPEKWIQKYYRGGAKTSR
jgi:hypothetical protein